MAKGARAQGGPGRAGQGKGNTAAVCYRLAQPVAQELGLALWDVRFVKEGATWFLRIFIDREDGDVSMDDCVAMSRRMDKVLDEADPIPQSYCLEVSSPGVERELTRPEHFSLCEGWPVVVRLIRPLPDGAREVAGILSGCADGAIHITTEDGADRSFSKKEISSVRLMDDELWDDDNGGETENE
ncbi:MAG TPA: ribosome maturation factor RimP [Firmicutes bacterium]|nr:ribosome maturation factor RimP [Bacillota bacterium]